MHGLRVSFLIATAAMVVGLIRALVPPVITLRPDPGGGGRQSPHPGGGSGSVVRYLSRVVPRPV